MCRKCCLCRKAMCTERILDAKSIWSQILTTLHKTKVEWCAASRSAYIFQMRSLHIFISHSLVMMSICCKYKCTVDCIKLLTRQIRYCVVMNFGHRVRRSSPLDPRSSKWSLSFKHSVQNVECISHVFQAWCISHQLLPFDVITYQLV